jgi:hypothetical protein
VVSLAISGRFGPRRGATQLKIDEKTTPDAVDATPKKIDGRRLRAWAVQMFEVALSLRMCCSRVCIAMR